MDLVEIGVGGKAAEILRTYQEANDALLYLDNAAKLSLQEAAYDFASDGFYDSDVSLGCNDGDIASVDYLLWSEGKPTSSCTAEITHCVPEDYDAFLDYFSDQLDSHISLYNADAEVELLESENYELMFNQLSTGLQVVGKAKAGDTIKIDKPNLHYEILPSFSESIDIDLQGDFEKIKEMAVSFIGNGDKIVESENLRWDIVVEEDCNLACEIGGACNTNDCEIVVNDPSCDDEESINLGGVTCQTTRVCKKSVWSVQYCEKTAFISVRVIDDAYMLPGEQVGYKKVVTENGQKDYTYRFALNWVEMGKKECI